MSALFEPGAYFRTAGGNTERPDFHQGVIRWAAWSINLDNGGNGSPGVWKRSRELWNAAGITDFPWLHCRSLADIDRLLAVGAQERSLAIGLNIEDVKRDFTDKGVSLADIAERISGWVGGVHMATLPWVQNGQGWAALQRCVAALEIFPDEQTNTFPAGYDEVLVEQCIEHAFDEGLREVTLMLKTKSPLYSPGYYGRHFAVCHSLYTGDDIPPLEAEWRKWVQAQPCLRPKEDQVPEKEWYEKPYPKGQAVGPEKLPRTLYPPGAGKGTFRGPAARAAKRAISRAQRWKPWVPSNWDAVYWELFAMGKGTGNVGDSGLRGFQRQEGVPETGVLDSATYQLMRRARVPTGPNEGKPIFDSEAVRLLNLEVARYGVSTKLDRIRAAIADFCERAEANAAAWGYTQKRPFSGLGVEPEKRHENDCSGYVILAYYWAAKVTGADVPDPSRYEYRGWGNTWDDLDGHPRVDDGEYLVGDLAHYDGHVSICRRAGGATSSSWSSFGSERGPENLPLHYRGDLRKIVRPPLLDT